MPILFKTILLTPTLLIQQNANRGLQLGLNTGPLEKRIEVFSYCPAVGLQGSKPYFIQRFKALVHQKDQLDNQTRFSEEDILVKER